MYLDRKDLLLVSREVRCRASVTAAIPAAASAPRAATPIDMDLYLMLKSFEIYLVVNALQAIGTGVSFYQKRAESEAITSAEFAGFFNDTSQLNYHANFQTSRACH